MRHSASVAALLTALLASGPASAQFMRAGVALGAICPFGTAQLDGCLQAPAGGTFQNWSAFTASGVQGALRQSGQSYGNTTGSACLRAYCHPPFNVPGVDYAVAYYTPLASLLDPAVSHPTDCTYSSTANGGYPRLTCSNGVTSVMGYNFAAVGGHGATQLYFASNVTGSITIGDNNFRADLGMCSTPTVGSASYEIYGASGSGTASFSVLSNEFDGQALPSQPCNGYNLAAFSFAVGANYTIEYNAFIGGFPDDTWYVDMTTGNGYTTTVKWNYADTPFGARALNHGEWGIIDTAASASENVAIDFNLVFMGSYGVADGSTLIWLSNGLANTPTWTTFDVSRNVVVANLIAGATVAQVPQSACITYTIDDGTDTHPVSAAHTGNILTIDTNTCGAPIVRGASPQGATFNLAVSLGNTGPGGAQQFYVDCTQAFTPTYGSACAESQTYPTINMAYQQTTAQRPGYAVAPGLLVMNGQGIYTLLTVNGNYLDATGTYNPGSPTFISANTSGSCTAPANLSGNVDMTTGNIVNSWQGTPGTGC
jgi:hypothetical protein